MGAALHDRRCIVYGAEAGHGPALVRALREAGAQVAITSATTGGAALFALKRLAGPGGAAQAVDLANPTNIRVATRKLAKQLGGLDVGRGRGRGGRARPARHRRPRVASRRRGPA